MPYLPVTPPINTLVDSNSRLGEEGRERDPEIPTHLQRAAEVRTHSSPTGPCLKVMERLTRSLESEDVNSLSAAAQPVGVFVKLHPV